jgi:hypothetical protein
MEYDYETIRNEKERIRNPDLRLLMQESDPQAFSCGRWTMPMRDVIALRRFATVAGADPVTAGDRLKKQRATSGIRYGTSTSARYVRYCAINVVIYLHVYQHKSISPSHSVLPQELHPIAIPASVQIVR